MGVQKLIQVAEALPTEQLFAYMNGLSFIPSTTVAGYLDNDYFGNYSGTKQVSPLLEKWYAQSDYNEATAASKLASIIVNRFGPKWEALFRQYASLETTDLLANINKTVTTVYGKETGKTVADTVESIRGVSETERKSTASTTDGMEMADSESPYTTTKSVSGGYSDSGSSVNTRSGSQVVTDKGSLLTSAYGFNSADPVPTGLSGPATEAGTTTETTFGEDGLKDSETSGNTRTYNEYKESTVENGVRHNISVGSGNEDNKKNTAENKYDSRDISSTEINSGRDVVTETGRDLKSLVDEYLALFMSTDYLNFFEVVFDDCDSVVTSPFFV